MWAANWCVLGLLCFPRPSSGDRDWRYQGGHLPPPNPSALTINLQVAESGSRDRTIRKSWDNQNLFPRPQMRGSLPPEADIVKRDKQIRVKIRPRSLKSSWFPLPNLLWKSAKSPTLGSVRLYLCNISVSLCFYSTHPNREKTLTTWQVKNKCSFYLGECLSQVALVFLLLLPLDLVLATIILQQ